MSAEQRFFERVVCRPIALGKVAVPENPLPDEAFLRLPPELLQDCDQERKQDKTKIWDDRRPLFIRSTNTPSSAGPSGGGVSSSFSFLARKSNPQPPSRRSQIVVVNASGQPIGEPKDDEDLKRLKEIQRFTPILKGCLPGHRDGTDIYSKIDSKPFIRFAHRFQTHLAICSQIVSSEQSTVFSNIVQTDQAMTAVTLKLTQNSRQFERLCEELRKVKELQERLENVDLLLQEVIPVLETLNELLPEMDRLPPLCLMPKSSYSSIGNSSASTPAAPSTATPTLDSRTITIEPAEECHVVDKDL
uniref:BLOC-1-related complex subunit 5 n=1 Tax=Panagrolaimus sp. ES5 TaxID=591445 RepID=A0AC34FPV3_9BILA